MVNYILTGNLNVNGNVLITGTVYDIKSLSTLVKKLEEGGYKDMMELTDNERTIDCNLEVNGNLILVTFDCSIKSELNASGTMTMLNTEVLE
ncbi:hypothetical protein [Bathycoccus sp. RCC716 virus 1]|uniref:Uncharacterized protein n=1 Tax=Bathycoccus sp. RCC716 virus 1 TaxID=2530038 RepID=A0A7S6SXC3_9PHYC|nr:hypothetical protein [Bathycoccus sp. RCC716 virus 1]